MIYTTYFANLKNLDHLNSCPIAICGKSPDGYKGLEYKKLAPKWWFFKQWKENHNNNFYTVHFYEEVLNPLSAEQVIEDFRVMINNMYNCGIRKEIESIPGYKWWEHVPFDIYLVCYEKPGDFCHRHLVADWLTANGIKVEEASV